MYGHTCIDVDKVDKVNAFTVTVRRAQVPKMQQKIPAHTHALSHHTQQTQTHRDTSKTPTHKFLIDDTTNTNEHITYIQWTKGVMS